MASREGECNESSCFLIYETLGGILNLCSKKGGVLVRGSVGTTCLLGKAERLWGPFLALQREKEKGCVYIMPTTSTKTAVHSQQSQGGGFSRLKGGPLGPSAVREAEATAALWEARTHAGAHMAAS